MGLNQLGNMTLAKTAVLALRLSPFPLLRVMGQPVLVSYALPPCHGNYGYSFIMATSRARKSAMLTYVPEPVE